MIPVKVSCILHTLFNIQQKNTNAVKLVYSHGGKGFLSILCTVRICVHTPCTLGIALTTTGTKLSHSLQIFFSELRMSFMLCCLIVLFSVDLIMQVGLVFGL